MNMLIKISNKWKEVRPLICQIRRMTMNPDLLAMKKINIHLWFFEVGKPVFLAPHSRGQQTRCDGLRQV